MIDRRTLILLGLSLPPLAACAPAAPTSSTPSSPPSSAIADTAQSRLVADQLRGAVYRGEWLEGFLYQVTFPEDLTSAEAEVYVIDSDAARTEYRMAARVEVSDTAVTLRFTKFDRVDRLTLDTDRARLSGYTVFDGNARSREIWAQRT